MRKDSRNIFTIIYNCAPMDIVKELKQQRDRLDAAIAALEGGRGSRKAANGRRKTRQGAPNGRRKGKRTLSAAARKRISEAAKARWAKAKKAGRNSL